MEMSSMMEFIDDDNHSDRHGGQWMMDDERWMMDGDEPTWGNYTA